MNAERIKVRIDNALDLLQLITEDVEDNLISGAVNNAAKARATITLSSLYVLSDYLRALCEEAEA